jgi:predicted phosphodiesterase
LRPEFKDKTKIVLAHHHFYKKNVSSSSSEKTLWDKIEHFTMKLRGKKKLFKLFVENDVKLVLHGHSHEMREYKRKEITFLNAGASVETHSEGKPSLFLVDVFPGAITTELSIVPENKKQISTQIDLLQPASIY